MSYVRATTYPDAGSWGFSFSHVENSGIKGSTKAEYTAEKDALVGLISTVSAIFPSKPVFITTRGNSAAWGIDVPDNVTIKQGV